MRYLGIDYGTKKVGLAFSDEAATMGFPHAVVPNTPTLADDLVALIGRESVGALVIGESKDFAGEDNAIAPAARALGDELVRRTGLPVAYEAEFLTTALARRAPGKEEKTRKPASRDAVDARAAALILTSYLERIHA